MGMADAIGIAALLIAAIFALPIYCHVRNRQFVRWRDDNHRKIAEAEEQLWTEIDRRQRHERIRRAHQREPKP